MRICGIPANVERPGLMRRRGHADLWWNRASVCYGGVVAGDNYVWNAISRQCWQTGWDCRSS